MVTALLQKIVSAKRGARLGLSLFLYAAAALGILTYHLKQAAGRGLGSAHFPLNSLLEGAAVVLCLLLLWRIANSFRESPSFIFTYYVLISFLMFFVIERCALMAVRWPEPPWLTQDGAAFLQVLGSMAAAGGALIVLPHLRSLREGSALARMERDKFLAAAESSLDDFYLFDGVPDEKGEINDFRFSYINPNAERRLRTRRENMIGKILTEERPFMIRSGLIERYREVVRTGTPFTGEVYLDDERIKATWLSVQVVKLGSGIAVTSRDVTEQKQLTDHVHHLAHYDQLTGLPNRTLLRDRLEQAIAYAQRHNNRVAVFILDVDHFKDINDAHGHAEGDAVLAAVGKRLLETVRETDTVARIGGDEFVIVMPEFKSLEDVRRCGWQIVRSAAKPIPLGDREIEVTVSVGLALYPDCGAGSDELLRKADASMYMVKGRGRNGLQICGEEGS